MKNWKKELAQIRNALDLCFSDNTANPSSDRTLPSAGHCAVVAMLINELYGGDYVSTIINGQSHWYNKIYIGGDMLYMWVDLTGDQFGFNRIEYTFDEPLYPDTRTRNPDELNENTKQRFMVFSSRYHKTYRTIHHGGCFELSEDEIANLKAFGRYAENNGIDIEAELVAALQTEIWAEITAETGETREDLDNKIIAEIKQLILDEKRQLILDEKVGKLKTMKSKKTKVKTIYANAIKPAHTIRMLIQRLMHRDVIK
jgi:hypothetical protein